MEQTCVIYRKGEKWYRTATEIPRDEGDIGDFPRYDERIYVETYGYVPPINFTLEQLVDLHLNHGWGKTGGLGLRGEHYKLGQHVPCVGHEQEVSDRAKIEGFGVVLV